VSSGSFQGRGGGGKGDGDARKRGRATIYPGGMPSGGKMKMALKKVGGREAKEKSPKAKIGPPQGNQVLRLGVRRSPNRKLEKPKTKREGMKKVDPVKTPPTRSGAKHEGGRER